MVHDLNWNTKLTSGDWFHFITLFHVAKGINIDSTQGRVQILKVLFITLGGGIFLGGFI